MFLPPTPQINPFCLERLVEVVNFVSERSVESIWLSQPVYLQAENLPPAGQVCHCVEWVHKNPNSIDAGRA